MHYRSQAAAIGSLDGFFLMRCFGDITPDDVRATLLGHEAVIAFRPQGSGSIIAVDATTTFPSEATRRASLEVARKTSHQTLGQVLIVLGEGFWASAIRGVMTTISSLTAATHPRKVVRHEEEGVDWVLELMGESAPRYRQILLDALAELKSSASTVHPVVSATRSPS